jgi:hypothetical protein
VETGGFAWLAREGGIRDFLMVPEKTRAQKKPHRCRWGFCEGVILNS